MVGSYSSSSLLIFPELHELPFISAWQVNETGPAVQLILNKTSGLPNNEICSHHIGERRRHCLFTENIYNQLYS